MLDPRVTSPYKPVTFYPPQSPASPVGGAASTSHPREPAAAASLPSRHGFHRRLHVLWPALRAERRRQRTGRRIRHGYPIPRATRPSPAHQVCLDLAPDAASAWILEPPGFHLHAWIGPGRMTTHVAAVGRFDGPHPFHDGGKLID